MFRFEKKMNKYLSKQSSQYKSTSVLFGNISIHNNRFCVFEAYHTTLCKFIRRNKVISLFDPLDENIYYSLYTRST